jgi:myo-inositol-1(or 4)-monophosphatase
LGSKGIGNAKSFFGDNRADRRIRSTSNPLFPSPQVPSCEIGGALRPVSRLLTLRDVRGSIAEMGEPAGMDDFDAMTRFAHRLADSARAETVERWLAGIACEDKNACEGKNEGGEFDPVTEADREAERAMRALIAAELPDHGVSGEEYGERPGAGRFCWSLDPIDGTRSFTCGLPQWTTLIALLDEGRPVIGLIDAPCLGERAWGDGTTGRIRRAGAEQALRTSGRNLLGEARLATTDPFLFAGAEAEGFDSLRRRARTVRYGLDGYSYARLAAGSLDLVVESMLKPHDYNALIPVVRAAGGVFGDWAGGEDYSRGKVIAAASPELFAEAVEAMHTSF